MSVVVPCLNEAEYIDECMLNLTRQDYSGRIEFIVADGESNDGTIDKLHGWKTRIPGIRIVANPAKTVSAGLNRAITAADGDVILRADVHTSYAPDYVSQCVKALLATGADNVGGPWRAVGDSFLQRGIAAAFQSPFGSGGARSRITEYQGVVDSVYLGCWRRQTLLALGLFDEELVRNQDDELNLRITRRGGRVWQTPLVRSWYRPRSSFRGLFRQYLQYGYWKVRVIQKHRSPASLRHLAPALAVSVGMLLAVTAPFSTTARTVLLACGVGYSTLSILASMDVCRRTRSWQLLPVLPTVFFAYHFSYGLGFLMGFIDFILLRRGTKAAMTRLSR